VHKRKTVLKQIKEGWFTYMLYKISSSSLKHPFKEVVENRLNICSKCPDLKISNNKLNTVFQGKCNICGCSFPAIVYAKSKKCPAKKW
tara:strand:- start:289 stop:552 length:264 start_codon:yes stop_codon:yes gene_type:complete